MKNRKLRFIILGSVSVISIIYFIVTLTTDWTKINHLKKQETELNQNLSSLKEDAENLKVEIEKLKDPEYIARFARKNFFYSKNAGEYVIKIDKKEPGEITIEKQEKKSNNLMIFALGTVLIGIIIYIRIRVRKNT